MISTKMLQRMVLSTGLFFSVQAFAIFIDGNAQYVIRGQTRTHPGFVGKSVHQAIDQNFRFNGELRANDKTSFFMEMRLFKDPRSAYLGDTAQPERCTTYSGKENKADTTGRGSDCENASQSTGEPGYSPYYPYVTTAYGVYAFDYCLLSLGRRDRHWGLGVFLNSGMGPFDTSKSVFDGVTCDINIQKSQTLGFSFGYDKLSETGRAYEIDDRKHVGGPADNRDDIDQYFITIEYDDRKANAGSRFTRQVGVYLAKVLSNRYEGSSANDLTFADLYTGMFVGDLAFRNEVIFRLGKSADPNWSRLGGATSREGDFVRNNVNSIGLAGDLVYYLSRSGAYVGPSEYNQGNATSHALFLGYAYAPGDKNGYKEDRRTESDGNETITVRNRETHAKAMSFHQNYKPALILFNERNERDDLFVDGIFDPSRVMNALVLTTGYRYGSLENGDFEFKLIRATLNEQMPSDIKAVQAKGDERQIGYAGNVLGHELDLSYTRSFSKELSIGVAGGYAIPGNAWKIYKDEAAKSSFLVQSHLALTF